MNHFKEDRELGNDMAKYLYEAGQLKRVKRSGWWIAGVKDPESVAEHSFRTAAEDRPYRFIGNHIHLIRHHSLF
jgi:hypothetical protein